MQRRSSLKLNSLPSLCVLLASLLASDALQPVRVTFLTDCTPYSHWMSLGVQFSFKMSGQPGKVTRVACCTDKEKADYPQAYKDSVDTWIAPSMATHPSNGDHYAPYNKPEAVIDYLQHNTPEEEYILVLDSDMILRRPFLVEHMHPARGLAIGAKYAYMIGVANDLAPRHIPEVTPRNDSLAGPVGRRGDQVGGFFFIHRDDLKKMSPLWLKYTEDVRFDEMAYKYSGDVYAVHPGDKPWISEMYGYAFGAAKADVWHKWDTTSMIYPAYEPHAMPKLMHYGLRFEVEQYKFDKHAHFGFDALACPPWDMTNQKSGIMKQAPRVAELTRKGGKPSLYYQDLLAVEVVATINAGLCDFHLSHCSPSKELYEVCKDVWERYLEVTSEVKRHEASIKCEDNQDKCKEWASSGECVNNLDFMEDACMKSCGKCIDLKEVTGLAPASSDYPTKLEKLAKDLGRTSDRGAAIAQAVGESSTPLATSVKGTATTSTSTTAPVGPGFPATSPPPPSPPPPSPPPPQNSPPPLAVRRAANVWPPRQPKMPPPPSPPWNTPVHQNEKVHCLRLALSMEETKKCVEAVKKGETYIPKDTHTSNVRRLGSQDKDVAGALGVSSDAPPPMVSFDAVDEETPPSLIPFPPVLLLLVLVVVAILVLFSRFVGGIRRKAKSGMRSE